MLSSLLAHAQQTPSLSNLRTKKISTKKSPVKIDSLSIVPNSVFIAGLTKQDYRIDAVNAQLFWINAPSSLDSISITYRVFPYKLNAQVNRMKFDDIKNNFMTKPMTIDNEGNGKGMFDFGNVNYNGSFGRGNIFWQ
ncbi:MAG: hypothetical protein IPK31_16835 [Chitinophagaceae bacterium]|nr:hypothetical protein [Chitinophagaceae bacterium]